MTHPLALRIVAEDVAESTDRIAQAANDPTLPWEEVSRLAGQENLRLLRAMERTDAAVDRLVDASTDEALGTGIAMFEKALPHADPEFIPDLLEGVNVLISRVRQQASAGRILPMNYMDMRTRKEIFLVESYMRAGLKDREAGVQ